MVIKNVFFVNELPTTNDEAKEILLDGEQCTTLKEFYEMFAKSIGLPCGIRYNPDSFTDYLEDIEDYVEDMTDTNIIIKNADKLFDNEHDRVELIVMFLKILDRVAIHWRSNIDYDGMAKKSYKLATFVAFNKISNTSKSVIAALH
jgi:hypothetical protein